MTTVAAAAPQSKGPLELTVRGIILGALITVVFTAANVYIGLQVGLTFASSIPAAVISMALLRAFKSSTIQENNIVQTIASAAGTLSSIIFVLPGLVMVGWWTGFPFWQSFLICVFGGVLGVMYSVPLRRAMVTGSDLPYPEGIAAAEVLQVGAAAHAGVDRAAVAESRIGLWIVIWGSIASAAIYVAVQTKLLAGEIERYARVGASTVTGVDVGLSLALIGIGHLVGVTVGVAMLAGIAISWGILVPVLTAVHAPNPDTAALAVDVFKHQARFIGAGAIGVAALWSIGRLTGPVVRGVLGSLAASRARGDGPEDTRPLTERDIPFATVAAVSALCLIPIAALLVAFLNGTVLGAATIPLILGALVYIVLAGIIVAAVCGYMAGLIGSSNSPVSGLAILTVLGAALLLVAVAHPADPLAQKALVAYALFVTAIILNIATISNDNLQDLKTGQLVGATPWKQQVALVIGVVFGALVIPPILNGLNTSFGFVGSPIHGISSHPLAAPQATLISALATGVITGRLPWYLVGWGALIGAIIVLIDEVLRRTGTRRFPPLAVALGIYLPMSVTFMVVVGSFIGAAYNRAVETKPNPDAAKRLGILLASGLIVGESLMGVVYSGLIAATKKEAPLALPFIGSSFAGWSEVLGLAAFVAVVAVAYRWTARAART